MSNPLIEFLLLMLTECRFLPIYALRFAWYVKKYKRSREALKSRNDQLGKIYDFCFISGKNRRLSPYWRYCPFRMILPIIVLTHLTKIKKMKNLITAKMISKTRICKNIKKIDINTQLIPMEFVALKRQWLPFICVEVKEKLYTKKISAE